MKTALQKFVETSQAKGPSPPIGSGALAAFVRQGAKEIAQAVPAFPDSMRVVEEPGVVGNLTPQEVFASKNSIAPQKALDMDMGK